MPDHTLQLVAVELGQRTASNCDGRIGRSETGRECVDSGFARHDEQSRRRDTRGQRHLLDDVDESAQLRISGRRVDWHRADSRGDGRSALPKRKRLEEHAAGDDQKRYRRDDDDDGESLRSVDLLVIAREISHREHGGAIDGRDERNHGGHEEEDQLERGALGRPLVVEEVHDRRSVRTGPLGRPASRGAPAGFPAAPQGRS